MGRGAIDDPFHAVREDAERALLALEAQPPVPAGAPPPPLLASATADIDDLRRAVEVAAAAPARFGLSAADVGRRRAVVDGLAARLRGVAGGGGGGGGGGEQRRPDDRGGAAAGDALIPMRARSTSVGRRAAGNGLGGAPGADDLAASTARENGRFLDAELATQSTLMASQDTELAELSVAVERIGALGQVMHAELGEQAALMEEVGDGLESAGVRMRGMSDKLRALAAEAGPGRFCLIIGLFFTFIILTMLVFLT